MYMITMFFKANYKYIVVFGVFASILSYTAYLKYHVINDLESDIIQLNYTIIRNNVADQSLINIIETDRLNEILTERPIPNITHCLDCNVSIRI